MQRTDFKARTRFRRLQASRWARRFAQREKKRQRRRECDPMGGKYHRIIAPKHFGLTEPRQRRETLVFVRVLRSAILDRRRPVKIDFRNTKKMFSCGTLLFLAELDRMLRRTKGLVPVRCVFPKDKIVEQVLHQVGILKLLRSRSRISVEEFDATVKHWHFATGANTDATGIDPMLTDFEGMLTPALNKSIFKGITEAMTNSVNHAYIEPRMPNSGVMEEPRWWLFSQELDGELSVVFCDLGIGIPRSLPRLEGSQPGWLMGLRSYLADMKEKLNINRPEPALIKAAIEIGQTRTNLAHRGKGLKQVINTIKQSSGKGEVEIHSNSGFYAFSPSAIIQEKLVQHSDSIMGTLIQWRVPIEQES